MSLQRRVAGSDQLSMHHENVEPAGTSLTNRMPDRTRLCLRQALRYLYVEVGKRDRAGSALTPNHPETVAGTPQYPHHDDLVGSRRRAPPGMNSTPAGLKRLADGFQCRTPRLGLLAFELSDRQGR